MVLRVAITAMRVSPCWGAAPIVTDMGLLVDVPLAFPCTLVILDAVVEVVVTVVPVAVVVIGAVLVVDVL